MKRNKETVEKIVIKKLDKLAYGELELFCKKNNLAYQSVRSYKSVPVRSIKLTQRLLEIFGYKINKIEINYNFFIEKGK